MSKEILFYLLMLLSAAMTASSQIMLKLSANRKHKSRSREYLNPLVITAYGLFGSVLLLNVYIYTVMDYRFGVVINALASLLVMLLSVLILKEKLTAKQYLCLALLLAGSVIIVVGQNV